MKKYITYFLICTYLFSFSEVRQILKMPNLIEHYISHKIIDNGTSVFSFVKMHYLDEHGVDGDYHQDMKLPFKTHDVSVNVFSFVFPPKKIEFNFEYKPLDIDEQQSFAYSGNFFPSVFQKIWQPPKI